MSHTPRGNDADAFEGTPYDHRMSTMCEMDEIFSLYCQNHDTVVATMGVYESNMTSLPMDSIQCVLAFTDPSGMAQSGPADREIIVKTLTGKSMHLAISGTTTVAQIKADIEAIDSTLGKALQLIYCGRD
eukprot:PhF_6_TR40181/c0_g5_i2/m.59581